MFRPFTLNTVLYCIDQLPSDRGDVEESSIPLLPRDSKKQDHQSPWIFFSIDISQRAFFGVDQF